MLKKKIFVIVLIAILAMSIFGYTVTAAPISDLPTTVTQPDGEELNLFVSGDEFFNYLHDADGNIIIKNYDTGYYTYAEIENNKVVAGDIEVTYDLSLYSIESVTPTRRNTIKFEDIPTEYIQNKYDTSPLNETTSSTQQTRGLVNERHSHPFLNETVNNIVIFIDFPDVTFDSFLDAEYFDGILNNNNSSLKGWFETASYGKTSLVSHLYPLPNGTVLGTYTDIYPRSTYQVHHKDSNGNDVYMLNDQIISRTTLEQDLLARAVNAVSYQITNDLNIDIDGNDYVDSVTFILAGDNGDWNSLLWSHKWSMFRNVYIHGKRIDTYTFVMENELRPDQRPHSALQHELFHLYGAPDLYHYHGYPSVVGYWDNMDGVGGEMVCTYMKYKYGNWIDVIPEIKSDTQTYTINKNTLPTNNCYVLRSPYSSNEFFVVEYRKQEAPFENAIPGSGIVIFRIDSRFTGNANYNGTTTLDEVFVAPNEILANDARYPKNGNEANLYLRDGTDAGITLSNFILSGDTASFDVTFSYNKLLNYFMDKRIVNAICTTLNKSVDEITDADLQTITSLSLNYIGDYDLSVDLTGIEHLSNLQTLILNNCKINDITPISQLTNLTHLELARNEIEDFSPLENLTSLTTLKIRGNITSDYSATAEYYDDLIEKDFTLDNQIDVVFNFQNYDNQQNFGNVRIICSDTAPDYIHVVIEKYSSDGTLLCKVKRENISLILNEPSIYLTSDFNCQDGSYIVISAYERPKFTKLISKCTVKPIRLDFPPFY